MIVSGHVYTVTSFDFTDFNDFGTNFSDDVDCFVFQHFTQTNTTFRPCMKSSMKFYKVSSKLIVKIQLHFCFHIKQPFLSNLTQSFV